MTTYIFQRLIQAFVVLILVSLVVFFIMRLMPGDPLIIYVSQSVQVQSMPPEQLENLRHQFGLDKPIMMQYFSWIANIFRGDFGTSIFYHEKVGKLMAERFPVSLYLGFISLVVGAVIGILAGILAAVRRGKWLDKIITPLTYVGITIPVFLLGILMIYVFSLKFHWLPTSGFTSPFEDLVLSTRQLVMPVICLAVFGMAANARQARSSVLETISQDYIRTAWSKGLSERKVIMKHVLKNSLIPVITLIGMGVGIIFGGAVLVETIFAIPGVGRLLVSSIFDHDYVVVQSITFVIGITILLTNLLVDISYGWFDPRIRFG
jgi:peptide/nickel transport system permease protein